MLDVRTPIGWLFIIYGILLIFSGLFHSELIMLRPGWTLNLNLVWGAVIGLFGLLMKLLAWLEKTKSS
jgi:hypothetical protein